MLNGNEPPQCPVCDIRAKSQKERLPGDLIFVPAETPEGMASYKVQCPSCGVFVITEDVYKDLPTAKLPNKHLCSAWLYQYTKTHQKDPFKIYEIDDLRKMDFSILPKTVTDKKEALMIALAEFIENKNKAYTDIIHFKDGHFIPEIAAKSFDELISIVRLLASDELITSHLTLNGEGSACTITSKGWERIDSYRKVKTDGKTVFVAMWFDKTTELYRKHVSDIILKCGYNPIIIDQHDYEGYIMDQVLHQIKIAKFIVADYTVMPEDDNKEHPKVKGGSRGGVYFEAGFAKGLNKKVIVTCKNDEGSKRRLHFDIEQINRIEWTDEDLGGKFNEKLESRILNVFGKGPL